MSTTQTKPLNDIMDFDHVIEVHEDGSISDVKGMWAPDLRNGKLDSDGWTLLTGYSMQDRYSGPIMHNSELLGGQMERDIRETPGIYVALVCYWDVEDEDDEDDIEGWAVARFDS